jgi:hypothetical protein
MLTFGGQDFQYLRVGLFDFHQAERRIDYWILESLPPRMPGYRLCCFEGLGIVADQLYAPLARQIDDVRVRPGPASSRRS